MKDEYNRQKILELEEKKEGDKKLPEKPFKSMVYGLKSFHEDKEVFHDESKEKLV